MNAKNQTLGIIGKYAASENCRKYSGVRSVVLAVLGLWLGAVVLLGSQGAFVGRGDSPPLALFAGVAFPLVAFFAAYFGWKSFREFILGVDLRLVATIQAWRWAGLGFLSLYAHDVLPALFAFPAGLGDMAIGFTAPWIALGLMRDRSFAATPRYILWNILGILDLVVAVSLGAICSGFIPGLTGTITTSPMAQIPLVLIPTFLVPIFIMLHVVGLAQSRHLKHIAPNESNG